MTRLGLDKAGLDSQQRDARSLSDKPHWCPPSELAVQTALAGTRAQYREVMSVAIEASRRSLVDDPQMAFAKPRELARARLPTHPEPTLPAAVHPGEPGHGRGLARTLVQAPRRFAASAGPYLCMEGTTGVALTG